MSEASRLAGAERGRAAAPAPGGGARGAVHRRRRFFLPADKVQVKYEMLRAHLVDGSAGDRRPRRRMATRGRRSTWWPRRSTESGMSGLLDEAPWPARPGEAAPRRSWRSSADAEAGVGADLAEQVADRFGVRLHRRTVERARRADERSGRSGRSCEAAQADYEALRAHLLDARPATRRCWPRPGSPAAGWPG